MVVYTGVAYYVWHAEITTKGFYKISKYKIFELFQYIDKNIEHSSYILWYKKT